MGCVGIIAEYNPFHNGHRYHLEQAVKKSGCSRVVVAMSGCFVQRGEPAMFSPIERTRWALEAGAHMVVALPAAFSLASAENFAVGGVRLLEGTGIVTHLAFGTEEPGLPLLLEAAGIGRDDYKPFQNKLKEELASGKSYPHAWRSAVFEIYGSSAAGVLDSPNAVLALEYLRAIRQCGRPLIPVPIKRVGNRHDEPGMLGGFSSASAIRAAIRAGDMEALKAEVPDSVFRSVQALVSGGKSVLSNDELSPLVLYALRRMRIEELISLADLSEGLENLFYRACRQSTSYGEMLQRIKTKRYTLSRIKRIAMRALTGITRADEDISGLFLRVLGVRRDAMDLLSCLSARASLPVLLRGEDAKKLPHAAQNALELEKRVMDIYGMLMPNPDPAGLYLRHRLIVV